MRPDPVEFGKAIAGLMRRYAKKREAPLVARLEQLEAEVARLRSTTAEFKYLGTWAADQSYLRGNFVTRDGSLWHCNTTATQERPGQGSDWTLAVKRGRDGR